MAESKFKPVQIRHEGIIRLSASGRSLRLDLNGKHYYCDIKKIQEILDGKRKYVTVYRFINKSK